MEVFVYNRNLSYRATEGVFMSNALVTMIEIRDVQQACTSTADCPFQPLLSPSTTLPGNRLPAGTASTHNNKEA
eukprot:350621-Chlamydomonas_euryale.AAC.2